MSTTETFKEIKTQEFETGRRRFLSAAIFTMAATELTVMGSANAQFSRASSVPAIKPGTNTSFGLLKQIDAGLLNVGYAEAGPAEGPPVIFYTAGLTTFTALSMLPLC